MSTNRSAMWFTICYISIVLFVCFVSTEIPDDPPYRLADDAVARLVNCRGNYTAQVRVDRTWYPLCDDGHYAAIVYDFCDMVKESVKQKQHIFGEPEDDVSSASGEFAILKCDKKTRSCVPEETRRCPNGGVTTSCDADYQPGSDMSKPSISTCSFPAVTTTNCTQTTLWMTYEHVFYHKDLPDEFIAWTSSYFKRSTGLKETCGQTLASTSSVTTNETTLWSDVDCLQYCLNKSAWRNISLSTVGIHANMCSCYADTESTEPSICRGDIYRVITSKRQRLSSDSNRRMEYCIAVQHSNSANIFTARACSTTKLPQLCGTHDCWPNDGCTNGATCVIARNYLNITCLCAEFFIGPKCEEKMIIEPDTDNETDHPYMPSTTPGYWHSEVDENPVPVELVWATCFGSIAVVIGLLVFFAYCIYKCKSKKPSGELQRPNSMLNRTYGTSHTNMSTYDRVDEDEEYDLLDEVAMISGHPKDKFNKGVLVLDEYSSPSDVILGKQDGNMTDYTTTYDDPIRKQSEHGSAIKLNVGLCGDTVINPNDDIELKLLGTAPALPGPVEKEGSESEDRKSQFKGCLCSMNVSAESDIENPEKLPKPHPDKGIGPGDVRCIDTHIEQEIDATTDEKARCSDGADGSKHYFKLVPRANSDQTEALHVCGKNSSMKEHIVAPNKMVDSLPCRSAKGADGTFLHSVILCQDGKTDKGQANDDSDYEDTSVVDAKENSDYEDTSVDDEKGTKTRHATMPMHGGEFCLHSPPEDLMERLGIRIVPDTSTYETYMALPKSRADLMNPYYTNYNQHNFRNMASSSGETNGASGEDDSCEYDVTISSRTKGDKSRTQGDTSNRKGSTDNEYDRLYNARRNLQNQNSDNNTNAYDHILSLLGKMDGRKRLNSY